MIYGVQLTGTAAPAIRAFRSKAEASSTGNSWMLLADAEELAASKMVPTSAIVALFNQLSEVRVERFSDRLSGAKRLIGVVPLPPGLEPEKAKGAAKRGKAAAAGAETAPAAAPRTPKKAPPEPKSATGEGSRRGKKSRFLGFGLHPSGEALKANPRRKGTPGYRSLQLIIDNPGILFDHFCDKGGRSKDLIWDMNVGNCEAKPPKQGG